MNLHEKINYVEFPARYLERTKKFSKSTFGWTFVDYGPEYAVNEDTAMGASRTLPGLAIAPQGPLPKSAVR